MTEITAWFSQFTTSFSDLALVISASFLFMLPIAIKFTGKVIGFVKSLIGTGGRKKRP